MGEFMSDFQRYAVYYLPEDDALEAFGAAWLGWDVRRGEAVDHLPVPGLSEASRTPRKYGFHGTLKPPFFLADGTDVASLESDLSQLAKSRAPVTLAGLSLSRIGKFLALVPEDDATGLGDLAFDCVTRLDTYRRPASAEELARRRAAGLTPRQDLLLCEWGYPYVADEFRFHLTLTGRLDPEQLDSMEAAASRHLPKLPRPYTIGSIALAGERPDGMFEQIHRYTLAG